MDHRKLPHLRLVKSAEINSSPIGPLHRLGLKNHFRPVDKTRLAFSIGVKLALLGAILFYLYQA